ncbi:unnamed protein product [Soboliphyme baturini]|uniref:DH domain-containing protein n=1 Tax=Soboliphyme baturini TaxID=241478 RepID=A0A183IYA7_9BILA|nr:unnamed protein product [Soboliphyme baturini]
MLQYSRQTEEPLQPAKMEEGFQYFSQFFTPYIPYCLAHVDMLCYIRQKYKESEVFREFLLWVQSKRTLGRLHLTDLLAKPMQRLTKYPLLLKAVLRNTTDGDGRASLLKMIEQAEEFATRVNLELCYKQQYDSLQSIMQCLESYDVIEAANDELDKV